jgi:polyferredoxin
MNNDVVWKCCCKRGTKSGNNRYQLYPTSIDENEHCIYCGSIAFAHHNDHTHGVVHSSEKSVRSAYKYISENGNLCYYEFDSHCDAIDRVDLYGRWNGKPIVVSND